MGQESTSINVLEELGILEPQEVAALLKLRLSTVLDLSRRGVFPRLRWVSTGAIGAPNSRSG